MDWLTRFTPYGRDIGGVLCLALGLMTVVALWFPGATSGLLAAWGRFLRLWLGWGAVWVPVVLFWLGASALQPKREKLGVLFWGRFLALELCALFSLALLSALGGVSIERASEGLDGGRLGWGLAEIALRFLGLVGLGYRLVLILVLLALLFPLAMWLLAGWLRPWLFLRRSLPTPPVEVAMAQPSLPGEREVISAGEAAGKGRQRVELPAEYRKRFRIPPPEAPNAPLERSEHLPPLELLSADQSTMPDERTINQTAGLIEKTLAEFGLPARVIGFRVGPTVTQFAVEPGYLEKNGLEGESSRQKVRVAQIAALARDLALALSAERLRIEAPVPGRPFVGIEVPNPRPSIVRLRPLLESEAFQRINSPLAIALGRDVSGQAVAADLAQMPHLLIAGTTGSGKSVCIAALTTCLVMNNTPQDLRLVMIDPKMVELVRFNGLPHLYGRVESDLERILAVLRWATLEMERRYQLLEEAHARNIDSYNRKLRRRRGEPPLPRLVIFIDELADLMMSAPEQTEHSLVRLAQMARAVGIHLVVATQRPGVEVVTGLIKANFPARISFAVASSVDSRVILDTVGAESLLGHGDMLYLAPDASGPQRIQGVMVSDIEVERVITFWQNAVSRVEPPPAAPWEEIVARQALLSERDELVDKAIEIVCQEGRASASLLQRRLRIGYPRAARLIDELEALGVIGPALGGGREREVLISNEDEGPEGE